METILFISIFHLFHSSPDSSNSIHVHIHCFGQWFMWWSKQKTIATISNIVLGPWQALQKIVQHNLKPYAGAEQKHRRTTQKHKRTCHLLLLVCRLWTSGLLLLRVSSLLLLTFGLVTLLGTSLVCCWPPQLCCSCRWQWSCGWQVCSNECRGWHGFLLPHHAAGLWRLKENKCLLNVTIVVVKA